MNRFSVQQMGPGSGRSIVGVHRSAFPKAEVELTIIGCAGAWSYFDSLLAFPELQPGHLFLGAMEEQQLIGYAHFRRLPESWHLNNIAVVPEQSGRGIGATLLENWAGEAGIRGAQKLSLDVNLKNKNALEWYKRMGFREIALEMTFQCPVCTDGEDLKSSEKLPVELVGWDAAEAWQKVYGFSSFGLRREEQEYRIERLGVSFFRVNCDLPAWVIATLTSLDKSRDLLTVVCSPGKKGPGRVVSSSIRMQKELSF